MAYRQRSYRDAQGEPRDPLADTYTDLQRVVEEDSGRHERIGEIVEKQHKFSEAVMVRFEKIAGETRLLRSAIYLLFWVAGAELVALLAAFFELLTRTKP